MASIGLPGTSGFVGEILILIGAFKISSLLAATTAIGIILAAAYGLWLYKRVIFGNLDKPHLLKIEDLNKREIIFFTPLVLSTIIIGVYPFPILDITSLSLENLLINYENAVNDQKISISDNFFNQLTLFGDYYG
jgi:NADH-quinone oxidoreductase subunit M